MGIFNKRDKNFDFGYYIFSNTGIVARLNAVKPCRTNLYENGFICASHQGIFYVVPPNKADPYGYLVSLDIFQTFRAERSAGTSWDLNELGWFGVATSKWVKGLGEDFVKELPRTLFFQPNTESLIEIFEEWRLANPRLEPAGD